MKAKPIGKTITKLIYEYSDGSTDSVDFIKPFEPVTRPVKDGVLYGNCSKCGLDLSKAMGYSCPNTDCPIQPQVSC